MLPSRAAAQDWDDAVLTEQHLPAAAPAGPLTRRSRMALEDGRTIGSIATAFHDTDDGFTARLSVTLPAICSPEVVEQHLEHFAVEFRTWILRAATELAARGRTAIGAASADRRLVSPAPMGREPDVGSGA